MKAKTKFMKMFYKIPNEARQELVFGAYESNPMSLAVCYFEIKNDTRLGKKILKDLGYEDD